jgi:HSP20 family molecular chaperone IbpA
MFAALLTALLAATAVARSRSDAGRAPAAPDFWAEQDKWMDRARKNLLQGSPIPFKDFDELFNDRFFSRRRDPFAEMLEFQKRLDSELGGREKTLFGRSWNDWFVDRMDLAAIEEKTRETDKEVIVEMKIRGLDGDSLNIDVNGTRIRVAYDAKKHEEKKDGNGREIFRSESVQHFEKVMPIPENADSRKSRIIKEGDVVKIIFDRRQGRSEKA